MVYNQRLSRRALVTGMSWLVKPLRLIKLCPPLCLFQNLPCENTVIPASAVLVGTLLMSVKRCQAAPSLTSPGLRLISLGVETLL